MAFVKETTRQSKFVQAIMPKLEVWKPLLVERAYQTIEKITEHEAGLVTDEELAIFLVDKFPVTIPTHKKGGN